MNTNDPFDQDDAPLRDLLDTLRSEYQDECGAEDLPPESLEDCDAETQRSVGWLREAWSLDGQSADALPTIPVARAAARLSARPRTKRLPRAAAGLIAIAAAVVALIALGRPQANEPDVVVDTPLATGTPEGAANSQQPPLVVPKTEFTPDQFRSRDDGVELVSGSVRLVLLTQGD